MSRIARPLAYAAAALLIVLVVWLAWRGAPPDAATERAAPAATPDRTGAGSTPSATAQAPDAPADAAPGASGAEASPLEAMAEGRGPWAHVDLEAAREEMPNNLYWKLAMPTKDAALLREREELEAYWNEQYGKVLSNTGSEEEVRAYYAHRERVSADYVEFTTWILDHYRDELPERDVGLLELARTLHLGRLEEIPGELRDALERREAHEAAREAWRAEQARQAAERAAEMPE